MQRSRFPSLLLSLFLFFSFFADRAEAKDVELEKLLMLPWGSTRATVSAQADKFLATALPDLELSRKDTDDAMSVEFVVPDGAVKLWARFGSKNLHAFEAEVPFPKEEVRCNAALRELAEPIETLLKNKLFAETAITLQAEEDCPDFPHCRRIIDQLDDTRFAVRTWAADASRPKNVKIISAEGLKAYGLTVLIAARPRPVQREKIRETYMAFYLLPWGTDEAVVAKTMHAFSGIVASSIKSAVVKKGDAVFVKRRTAENRNITYTAFFDAGGLRSLLYEGYPERPDVEGLQSELREEYQEHRLGDLTLEPVSAPAPCSDSPDCLRAIQKIDEDRYYVSTVAQSAARPDVGEHLSKKDFLAAYGKDLEAAAATGAAGGAGDMGSAGGMSGAGIEALHGVWALDEELTLRNISSEAMRAQMISFGGVKAKYCPHSHDTNLTFDVRNGRGRICEGGGVDDVRFERNGGVLTVVFSPGSLPIYLENPQLLRILSRDRDGVWLYHRKISSNPKEYYKNDRFTQF